MVGTMVNDHRGKWTFGGYGEFENTDTWGKWAPGHMGTRQIGTKVNGDPGQIGSWKR